MLETESEVKDKITLMVSERYLDTTLEEVILTCTFYARDLEMLKLTEKVLSGKKPKVGIIKVKNEEFEKCKQEGKCFRRYKEDLDVKYKECTKHNKMNMSEEDRYKKALSYTEHFDGESDVKMYKIGSVMLMDSGGAFTSVNDSIDLQNVRGTRLEYVNWFQL